MPLSVLIQYLLPKRWLTQLAGALASRRLGWFTRWAIARFVTRYGVDMAEAEHADPAAYPSFNAFFGRALRPEARPLHPDAHWLCPVDGSVSQFGALRHGQLLQAKGHHYDVAALLGAQDQWTQALGAGHFATLYLSPRDYHRIHMPCDAQLRRMVYVPGDLFSVNPQTAQHVPGLFARNERVVCLFDTTDGPLAMVLVGATVVGSVATTWHGVVHPPRQAVPQRWDYDSAPPALRRGQEMGRFLLGSTVVLVWSTPALRWADAMAPGAPVRMGQALAWRAQ
jgi:phosphatidylserine decarboxylase